jgi:hypothetical protein
VVGGDGGEEERMRGVSYIEWNSEHGDPVRLSGRERAWMGSAVGDTACSFISFDDQTVRARINPEHYLARSMRPTHFIQDVGVSLRVGYDEAVLIDHDGTPLDSFSLLLNTILAIGNDPLCLMARIHGQCEIHCYVEGPNRAWMADLIDQGRAAGVYRPEMGWERLAALLRSRDDEPVVAEYSVTGPFPRPPESWRPIEDVDDDDAADQRSEEWSALPAAEQWALAMAVVRSRPERELELRPDRLRSPFGHERSLIDLFVSPPLTASVPE